MIWEKEMRSALGWSVAVWPLLVAGASGQYEQSPVNPTSTMDAYGNARPSLPERRPENAMLTPLEQTTYRGFQTSGRRIDQRGGFSRFALPTDLLPFERFRALRRAETTATSGYLDPGVLPSFNQYGGFRPRAHANEEPEIGTVLRRRQELVSATGLNAPVHRALNRGEGAGVVRSLVAVTPVVQPVPVVELSDSSVASPLDELLHDNAFREYDRVELRAWQSLYEGSYRSAARAFETVSLMEPSNVAARLGFLFAHLGLQSHSTARAVVSELSRRKTSPFLAGIDLSAVFADATVVRRLRVIARTVAVSDSVGRRDLALQTLVLWYLGEPEEALALSRRLVARSDASAFASWPDMILTAQGRPGDD